MKFIFLFLLLPFISSAQFIRRSAMDTSHQWQVQTVAANLKTASDGRLDVALFANGPALTVQLSGNGVGANTVLAGDRVIFLLENDSTVTAQSPEVQTIERKGGSAAYHHLYALSTEAVEALGHHNLKALRKYSTEGYDEIYPDKQSNAKLKELSQAFFVELKKAGLLMKSSAPAFPGGKATLLRFLNRNLKTLDGVTGAERKFALAQFTVMADGRISDATIVQSAGVAFDEEFLRLLKRMPNWKPATTNGKLVAATVLQPLTFLRSEGKVSVRF